MTWGRYLWSMFSEVLRAVLPICVLLLALKAALLGVQSQSLTGIFDGMGGTVLILIGIAIVVAGLSFFLKGLEFSLIPLSENLGTTLPNKAHMPLIALFSLLLGALAAVAEPDLKVYVDKAIELLGGQMSATTLVAVSAVGTAVGFALGILRIAFRWRFAYVFVPIALLACALTLVCPKPLNLAAWDVSPVISGAVTVPLFLALGIGLGTVMGGENAGMAGFGLVTLASLGPVVALLLYGAVVLRGAEAPSSAEPVAAVTAPAEPSVAPPTESEMAQLEAEGEAQMAAEADAPAETEHASFDLATIIELAREVLMVIVPVYAFLMFFQKVVLRSPIRHLTAVLVGVGVIVVGLVLFLEGLESGFFPLVEGVGTLLPKAVPIAAVVVGSCVVLGLVCTFAEPSVMVFARQIEEATAGAIHKGFMLVALGVGVAFGFGIGILRIWLDIPLPYVLLPILVVEALLTLITMERYAMIAWDSMGVASGSVTVPFFLAMGLGIASAVSPDAASAGLGLVTMASVGPVLSVLCVGLVVGRHR